MANRIKCWRKTSSDFTRDLGSRWENKKDDSKLVFVLFLDKGKTEVKLPVGRARKFKTQSQANNFAKSWMRKHGKC